jgi:ataxia telangiectasia mutated family protein
VDGLGPTGHRGLFNSSAESTLTVLRKNTDSLLTILSAVVNDPLYKWSVSPLQASRRQQIFETKGLQSGSGKSAEELEDRNEAAE